MPYFALRRGPLQNTEASSQGHTNNVLRQSRKLPDLLLEHESEFIHESQISLLVTGIDEWAWTAHCLVDTHHGNVESVQNYREAENDGPSGEAMERPAWNPREYFLLVLSRRFRQVTKEWDMIVRSFDSRLQLHVGIIMEDAGMLLICSIGIKP